jgi:hypothetical protein
MPIQQVFNKKTGAWVKFKFMKNGKAKFLDVKQRNPRVPFKGIKKSK